ncbi:MAG: NADH-quinone oxidoreductase subunit K [Pseudomonadota bacterium]
MGGTMLIALLAASGGLFVAGAFGLVSRRGVLFQLISIEIMLGAPALAFIAAGAYHGNAAGQGMYVLVLALAAAEAALGLALYVRLRRGAAAEGSVGDSDGISELKR